MRGYLSLSEPEVPEEALTAHTLDPEQLVIQSEETDARNRRIETLLSLFERQVLKLYLSSYSYEEMSKQLGSSTKAVDNALQRVRRKLRTVFTLEWCARVSPILWQSRRGIAYIPFGTYWQSLKSISVYAVPAGKSNF